MTSLVARVLLHRLFSLGLLREKGVENNLHTVSDFKEAIGKEITSIGSDVKKTLIDSVKKRAQDSIQSGGHHLVNVVFEN